MTPTGKINIFDFDGTLSTDTWPKFWVWIKKFGLDGTHRNDELESALAEYRAHHDGDNLETFFAFFSIASFPNGLIPPSVISPVIDTHHERINFE